MARPIRIRLSEAQAAALECREIHLDPDRVETVAFTGTHLVFEERVALALDEWLSDMADAEDYHADELRREGEHELATLTRRAGRSLWALSNRVSRRCREQIARDFFSTTNDTKE
jgi:hypothetical protein